MRYFTTINGIEYEVDLLEGGQVRVNDQIYEVDHAEVDGQRVFTLLVDGQSYEAYLTEENGHLQVVIQGVRYNAQVVDEHEKVLRAVTGELGGGDESYTLTAPMPGLVVDVPVSVGEVVEEGSVLVILESMKMQNELKSPRPGVVAEVNIQAGDQVEKRDILLVVEQGN